jgi:hypothetical protein
MKKCVDGVMIEMTSEEETVRQAEITSDVADTQAMLDKLAQKETDKANGRQKLKDLGLTDAEVDALIGN